MARFVKEVGLGFNDVSLVPQFGVVASRKDINLKSALSKVTHVDEISSWLEIDIPLIAANMSAICEEKMAIEMARLGGAGFLHRYKKPEEIIDIIKLMKDNNYHPIVPSIGVGDKWIPIVDQYFDAGADAICIDIAHGHCQAMIDLLKQLKHNHPFKDLIAGNIATTDAARDLMSAGATGLKVGIAQGSVCTTRTMTGAGVPQITAIMEVASLARPYNVPVISDGGARTSGDIVKALAAGANAVMSGSLFAGTSECPDGMKNKYFGMASAEAKNAFFGNSEHVEGTSVGVVEKGPVANIVQNLLDGIRSGISYCGASSAEGVYRTAEFIEVK